jgi:NADH dehydrogenase [ubiquinone] 1 alpha subcomplex assembly factor 7
MGLDLRVERLKRAAANEGRKDEIEKAARRLVDLTGMGTQYQVMGITGRSAQDESAEGQGPWPFVSLS